MKEIKRITVRRNVRDLNINHNATYENKKGVIIVEYEDNTKSILDLKSGNDITGCDFLKILKTRETEDEVIFEECSLALNKEKA